MVESSENTMKFTCSNLFYQIFFHISDKVDLIDFNANKQTNETKRSFINHLYTDAFFKLASVVYGDLTLKES